MTNYQITLTQAENQALSFVAFDQNDWIQNAVHERCRIAIEEVVAITIQKCLDGAIQVPSTKDEIVSLAFQQGWVKTAAQRQEEHEAEQAARAAQSQAQ